MNFQQFVYRTWLDRGGAPMDAEGRLPDEYYWWVESLFSEKWIELAQKWSDEEMSKVKGIVM